MTKKNHWFPRKEKSLEEQKPLYAELPIFDPPPPKEQANEKRGPIVIDISGDDEGDDPTVVLKIISTF